MEEPGVSAAVRLKERDVIEFVLPDESPGYSFYRNAIRGMIVLAEGRRGPGNIVLGNPGGEADIVSPLAQIVAYGTVESTADQYSVTVRELAGDQIDIEIVSRTGSEIPDHFEEKRRWTYSTWKPGEPSPATSALVREVRINSTLTLAIASTEKRIWLHDAGSAMNLLIPVTNFHNELMLYKRIRDPNIALKSQLFFEKVGEYSEADLRAAFIAYNRIRRKGDVASDTSDVKAETREPFLRMLFGRKTMR